MEQKLHTPQQTLETIWTIDVAHSTAEFTVRHMMIANVRGRIPIKGGSLRIADDQVGHARIDAELDVAGIDTGVPARDDHLRSADFFDAKAHPVLRFTGSRIEPLGDDRFRVIGELRIRDVAREVALEAHKTGEARDPWGNERVGIEARTTIDRRDFGLTWNQALETGGVLVSDKVKVELSLELVRGK